MGRLVNVIKHFIYLWWLRGASNLCSTTWSLWTPWASKNEPGSLIALKMLLLVTMQSQIEYLHQSFADILSRFSLKAGTIVTGIVPLIGLYLSNSIAATALVANSCDLRSSLLTNWFCHSYQSKSIVQFLC
jgi:hypothetical protein